MFRLGEFEYYRVSTLPNVNLNVGHLRESLRIYRIIRRNERRKRTKAPSRVRIIRKNERRKRSKTPNRVRDNA